MRGEKRPPSYEAPSREKHSFPGILLRYDIFGKASATRIIESQPRIFSLAHQRRSALPFEHSSRPWSHASNRLIRTEFASLPTSEERQR